MAKRKPGFSQVDFFSGINTPSKKDDKRITFTARNLGKKSKLPRPKRAKALRNLGKTGVLDVPKGMMGGIGGIPKGILGKGGDKFDRNFGIGQGNLFNDKIGLDPNFGKGKFDVDFTSEFARADFVNQPSAIDPVPDDVNIDDEMEDQFLDEVDNEVPTLLDSLPKIDQGQRIPLTDEDEDRAMKTKRKRQAITDSGFENVRFQQMQAGGEALTPEEQENFQRGRAFRGQAGTSR